jgi:hypothetical protein
MPAVTLALFISWCSWALMIVVGILHSIGFTAHTLGYDQASGIAWCLMPPVLFLIAGSRYVTDQQRVKK